MNEETSKQLTVYYVQEGRMHRSWIIGHVDFEAQVADDESYTTPEEVTANIIDNDPRGSHKDKLTSNLLKMIERPGRWYYLSGVRVVHAEDCYPTREEAAEAYKNFLLGDNE